MKQFCCGGGGTVLPFCVIIYVLAQSPTVSIQSVTALAESLVEQNNGIIVAIDNGRKQRAQLEATVVKPTETINDSVKIRDQKIVEALLNEGKESQEKVKKKDVTPEND